MADSIAATSLLRFRPRTEDVLTRRKPVTKFFGSRVPLSVSWQGDHLPLKLVVKSQAMELTKDAYSLRRDIGYGMDTAVDRRPDLWPPENRADNPALNNPLIRQHRMGCGWFGAIFEWEGVLVEDNPDLEKQAWLAVSQEEGKSPPPAFILRRIEGMKNEQAMSEVLCWSRDPGELKRMGARKEEIQQALQGGIYRFRTGSQEFMEVLMHHKVPMALVSTRSRESLERAINAIGIKGVFNVIVAAEDVYRGKPDPEMFVYAAQPLQFIPERCIVFGNSNQTVEAAHDARMKCVAVASKHPVYELSAADLVVRRLNELSVVDLKNLADIESAEFEPEMEMETEDEDGQHLPSPAGIYDSFW